MITCPLCNEEYVFVSAFCSQCTKLKRILNVYGREEVLLILEKVCLRSEKQREHKILDVKKNLSDSIYIESNGIRKVAPPKGPRPN